MSPGPEGGVVLGPGAGFGDGSHETTQLCLRAIAAFAPRDGAPWRMLDFGSGTGILAIAAARRGAEVEAVEIDPVAIATARENARLNGVEARVRVAARLPEPAAPFTLVVANILRPVLLAHADALVARLAPGGTLVLSGLVATDAPEVGVRYGALLDGRRPEIYARGDWRALAWRR